MKKSVVIFSVIIAVLLIGVYAVYASFNGSLIHKAILTDTARDYIAENYPSQELEVDYAVYDFKLGGYHCDVQSPTSVDTAFDVYETSDGKLEDDYEIAVVNKENTIRRISIELDRAVDEIFPPAFPHRTRLVMCDYCYKDEIDRSKFELDMKLDLACLPQPAELTVWVETSGAEPTWEEAARLLREMAHTTDDLGLDISYYSISVEYPYDETDGERKPSDYGSIVGASEVPKEIVESDGLEAFLAAEREKRELEQQMIDNGEAQKD